MSAKINSVKYDETLQIDFKNLKRSAFLAKLIEIGNKLLILPALRNEPVIYQNNPYIHAATSANTRRAYQTDIRHFEDWGGRLPTNTQVILDYLQTFAPKLNPRTLSRRLIALKHWHLYQGFSDPTQHPAPALPHRRSC